MSIYVKSLKNSGKILLIFFLLLACLIVGIFLGSSLGNYLFTLATLVILIFSRWCKPIYTYAITMSVLVYVFFITVYLNGEFIILTIPVGIIIGIFHGTCLGSLINIISKNELDKNQPTENYIIAGSMLLGYIFAINKFIFFSGQSRMSSNYSLALWYFLLLIPLAILIFYNIYFILRQKNYSDKISK